MDLSARQILDRLVAFPTVSRDSNLALVDWVETYLASHGVKAHRVPNADGTKASLWASIGPDVAGGVVLSGHTDVVPVDGQDWTGDPWTVRESDGRLYGRGTCDMKGFDALALWAVPLALKAGLKRPLQIALSHDEEVGCVACVGMIEDMVARASAAAAVIVGEPSRMKVVTGHKGGLGYLTHLRGYEVHSSIMHRGVNAIMEGARLIDWANRQNAENAARTPGPLAAAFDPPWTTLHVGRIAGGTAENITAGDCRFGFTFRVVPGEDPAAWGAAYEAEVARLAEAMRAVHSEAGITLQRYFAVPALQPEEGGAAEALARRLTGDNAVHVVSYGTEAGQFQTRGYSTVVCGPGDIAQAHQADEYIEVSEFEAGQRFIEALVADLAR
ncbi:MAG: acetylornithine deacetylase [Defluviimonas sp.]|uniref:acetylornithine deacetylase n=1 Tax=Albidovulum sp. TaxID=1872424 RepID=UPI001D3DCD3A|nr:acetylornithine deacetylase [Paracoccaceae bacterium]MCC0064860.1 acetylornithine deacetylase [Defluviimonas sp.]